MASDQTINNMISDPRCPRIEVSALYNESNSEVLELMFIILNSPLLQHPYLPGNNCHLLKSCYIVPGV